MGWVLSGLNVEMRGLTPSTRGYVPGRGDTWDRYRWLTRTG
jgi:hypothetical protein